MYIRKDLVIVAWQCTFPASWQQGYFKILAFTEHFIVLLKMYLNHSILLVLCFSLYSSSASTTLGKVGGTCVNPTTLSFIENSLTNLSITSLSQLSLLKEMTGSSKEKSCKNNNSSTSTSIANLSTKLDTYILGISNKMNTSAAATNARLSAIETQVSSLSSDLKKIFQLLSKHVNITLDDEDEAPSSFLLSSCEAILSKWPNSPSGYYSLVDVNGHTRHVYCHMETLCGKGGGWRRIASLNMTDPNEKCPTQFRLYSQGGVRACGRPVTSGGSCVGITFPSRDIKYSQVCGKMIGYQYYTTDGAAAFHSSKEDINSQYIDGISLTHGYPRKHIWSLISGYSDVGYLRCPCGGDAAPSFVGSDYTVRLVIKVHVHIPDISTLTIHYGMVKIATVVKLIVVNVLLFLGFISL